MDDEIFTSSLIITDMIRPKIIWILIGILIAIIISLMAVSQYKGLAKEAQNYVSQVTEN